MRGQSIFVSATPGDWELEQSHGTFAEQVIRPTGLADPVCVVRPIENQIDDLIEDTTDRIYNILNQQLIFYGDYDTAFNRELRDAVKYHVTDYFTD